LAIKWGVLIGTLLLIACSHQVKTGVITDKQFFPAHDDFSMMPIITCSGTPAICSTMLIPQYNYVPDGYQFTLKNCDETEKCKKGTIWVTKENYDSAKLGDTVR
jgi:hypothetical protein